MINVLPQLEKLKASALDFLFPQKCVGCGAEGSPLCPSCRRRLPRIMPPLCPRCGRPQASGVVCPPCLQEAGAIDGVRAPFRFEGTVRRAVHSLKYQNIRALARPLAELMAEHFTANPVPAEVLVPVPLHPKRLRERGYNQSGLLARELGRLISLPVVVNCLVRNRYAPPQVRSVAVSERRANVAGAFSAGSQLRDRRVLLIDDVSTTGATLEAGAVALKAAGAASAWGLVLAREL